MKLMKYSVKDLSNILGITTSAIHFFEKENLIKVSKEKMDGDIIM
jgi:DNA-binding transcriptional MerR regulator